MTLADRVKQDLTSAMKAGEKDRVGALRLVLSELQKDAKEGAGDELAVLRRERKRRHESAAAFRDGGHADRAVAEEAEAEIIQSYLPAELSDEELRAIVADAPSWPRPRRPRPGSSRPTCRPSSPTTSCARSSMRRSPSPARARPRTWAR